MPPHRALLTAAALLALLALGCGARSTLDLPSVERAPGAILFGGFGAAGALADTWRWTGAAWTELGVDGPSARGEAVLASLDGTLVLFGGLDGDQRTLGDTWTWDGAAWTELGVSGPPARQGAVLAPLHGKLVLFGGFDGSAYLGDTWTWDGATWTELAVSGPSKRSRSTLAPAGDALLLFGGLAGTDRFADTWTWDGAAWTELHVVPSPSARDDAVEGALGGDLVLFGGFHSVNGIGDGAGNPTADTWAWGGSSWSSVAGAGPSARYLAAGLVPFADALVLFGGLDLKHQGLADTWTWSGAAWTQRTDPAGPPARNSAALAAP